MKNIFRAFLFLILLLASAANAATFGAWRPTKGDLYDALRANAPFYWNWLHQNAAVAGIFQFTGVVTGDAHILNFADIELAQGGRVYGLVDMDDGGANIPMIADYVHYYIGNQLSTYKASSTDLWQAYISGLQGQSAQAPDLIVNMQQESESDFAQAQAKYIDKITKKNHFNKKAGLSPLDSSAGSGIQQMYQQASVAFAREMSGYQILDSGYKIKDGGGSQGLPRFWFLLSDGNDLHVWEFKQEVQPATSLYAAQTSDPFQRFNQIAAYYRPASPVLGPYKFLAAGPNVFLLRERMKSFLKLDPTKKKDVQSVNDGKQLAVYLANQLGLWQSAQPQAAGLLNFIQQNSDACKKALDQLGSSYVDEMKRQQKAAGY